MGFIQFALLLTLLIILSPLLGRYIAFVYSDEKSGAFAWLEGSIYRLCGVNPTKEMSWKEYAKAVIYFNLIGLIFLISLLRVQGFLPLNPENFGAVPWLLAINTAISFVTNTNWQAYPGESTLSYLTQMMGLTVQNFTSAATGLSVFFALIRGLARKKATTIGNFWRDLVRSIIYLLLPLSIPLAIVLTTQGVVQTFSPYVAVKTIEQEEQIIALGPVASQVAIKQLGTNGGGFFNANSAHPFENPNGLTNFLETLALILIPASLVHTYGILIGSKRHGWILFMVMLGFWLGRLAIAYYAETMRSAIDAYPLMEGKEARFGILGSIIFAMTTTNTSAGSVNAMMSSLSPLAGGIALFNIMLGEIIFGGIGVGMCGMIMFVLLTVFLAGLMVGRTPEYLGKKIEKSEMRYIVLAVLAPSALILIGSGISSVLPMALISIKNQGPHGLTEILYAFSSAAGNNGSSFAGLDANTPYYNIALGIVILCGRVAIIVPSLAIAGLLVKKNATPATIGMLSTNTLLFAILLITVILIMSALTFFPALILGPVVEHLLMLEGRFF